MRKYYPGITLFKLVGALSVLIFHVMAKNYINLVSNLNLRFVDIATRTTVPCFYVLAGFLAYHGWIRSNNSNSYIKRYLTRICLTYGVFCLIFVFHYIVPELMRNKFSFNCIILQTKIFIAAVVLNGPYLQLWFIPPLIFSVSVVFWLHEKGYFKKTVVLVLLGFILSQFISGSLINVTSTLLGSSAFLESKLINYVALILYRYIGFGFTFVYTGVLIGKYEEKFLRTRAWKLIAFVVFVTVLETYLLNQFAVWDDQYKLTFSVLPNALLFVYGILHIRLQKIRQYHSFISVFSIFTYFTHIQLSILNTSIFKWIGLNTGNIQPAILLILILIQCLLATYFIERLKVKQQLVQVAVEHT